MRFRRTLRQQQRIYAQQYLAFQDKGAEDAKLADPSVPERVKRSILDHREWASKAAAAPVPKKRLPREDSVHKEPLERDILKAIVQAFKYHPRVIKCVRANSGGAYFRNAQGKDALVTFTSEPVPDLHIMLRNPAGWGWLEIKRPSFKAPRDAREERQAAFLAAVREAGGIGEFVTSVQQALDAINGSA